MNLSINGKTMEMCSGMSVAKLLTEQNIESPEMVSVELNNKILAKEEYPGTELQEGDNLEFLYFMGGGTNFYDRFKDRI